MLPNLVSRWFSIVDDNPLLVNNFFGVLRNSSEFIENQFLSLINGILTFAEQKLFTKKIKNEDSLNQLFLRYHKCWSSFYSPTKTTTDEMVKRRHILVHNSKRVDQTQLKNDDFRLHWFRTQLQFVSAAIIMRELGFSEDVIDDRLSKLASNLNAFNKENS